MKIIISPAKKMNMDTDSFAVTGLPVFIRETGILMKEIKALSLPEAKALWKCNDKLARLNYERFRTMDLEQALTPAVMAYEGLQYQHLAPKVLTRDALSYIQEHLYILSGFYGLLRPFDGVTPYRLEMQAKLRVKEHKNLYDFWGDRLYRGLFCENPGIPENIRTCDSKVGGLDWQQGAQSLDFQKGYPASHPHKDRILINLASREYSQCVEKYITKGDRFITVEFGQLAEGKVKQKGTLAKMARGEMVRFLAENHITDPEGMREFCQLGFSYSKELSRENRYVFVVK